MIIKLKYNPCKSTRISDTFGVRSPSVYHNGIDIAPIKSGIQGDEIYSVDKGVVKLIKFDKTGYGNYLVIEHNDYCTLYAHLKEYKCKQGDTIKAGQIIGIMGFTGYCIPSNISGTHLHFEIRNCKYDSKFWQRDSITRKYIYCIDPKPYLLESGDKVSKIEYYETANKTRILCGDSSNFHIGISSKGISNSKLNIENGINGTFYYSGLDTDKVRQYYSTSLLYIDYKGIKGVQGTWTANHYPYKQSCLIKYKDSSITMKAILNIAEIQNELYKIEFILGGVGLFSCGKLIKHENEGFKGVFADISRKANKTLIGVNSKTKKIYLVTRENIKNREQKNLITKRKLYDLEDLAKDLSIDYGCDYVIQLDGGGSTTFVKDGKNIISTGRIIHSYCYFE